MIVIKLKVVMMVKTSSIYARGNFVSWVWDTENSKIVLKTAKFADYHLQAFVVVVSDKVGFFCNIHFSYSN